MGRMLSDTLDSEWKGTNKNYKKEVVKIEGKIMRETEAAILFGIYIDGIPTEESHWIPLSQVSEIHREYSVVNNKLDSMIISQWIASKKGLG